MTKIREKYKRLHYNAKYNQAWGRFAKHLNDANISALAHLCMQNEAKAFTIQNKYTLLL